MQDATYWIPYEDSRQEDIMYKGIGKETVYGDECVSTSTNSTTEIPT